MRKTQREDAERIDAFLGQGFPEGIRNYQWQEHGTVQQLSVHRSNPVLGRLWGYKNPTYRIRAIIAANRSGKTYTGGADIALSALHAGGAYWACCNTDRDFREILAPKLRHFFGAEYWSRFNNQTKLLEAKNPYGRPFSLGVRTYESGITAFMGADVDGIWFDEEPPKDIFSECWTRLIDRRGFILLTCTPILAFRNADSWIWDAFVHKPEFPAETRVWHFHMEDNEYMDEKAIEEYKRMIPAEELELRMYGLEAYRGITAIFDVAALTRLRKELLLHPAMARPNHISPLVTVWQEPQKEATYVIGADVSEGLEGGDYDAAEVLGLDHVTGRIHEDAQFHGNVEPFVFARHLAEMSAYYNDARVAVEINGPGLAVVKKLRELKVPQFTTKRPKKRGIDAEHQGIRTTAATKPAFVALLQEQIRTENFLFRSLPAIDECMGYVHDGHGRMRAQGQGHDDRVIALVMACVAIQRAHPKPATIVSTAARPKEETALWRYTGKHRRDKRTPMSW